MANPRIIYGTAWKGERTRELVEEALEAGFRAFDTANQPRHYQEPLVGEALRSFIRSGGKREDLFIQTKFTPVLGHDHRIPYDPEDEIGAQVKQSFESSLEHLQTEFLDSYLLHGPYSFPGLSDADWEVWRTMEELHRAGRVRSIGISNASQQQIVQLCETANVRPAVVQNRCFARLGWDRAVREHCRTYEITYQGFSLLTGNPRVLQDAGLLQMARKLGKTPQQIIYRFAIQIGMVPLTGTTDRAHMKEALEVLDFELDEADVRAIEGIEG